VTVPARRLCPPSRLGNASIRRLALALGSGAIISSGLLCLAPRAGAVVKTIETTQVGLQPRVTGTLLDGDGATAQSFENASGAPVLHSNSTYAVYWDPTDHYHGDWQRLINGFLQGIGAESGSLANVFAVDTQYTDRTNRPAAYASTFMGAYTDTNPYPTTGGCTDPAKLHTEDLIGPGHTEVCLTDKQIREQLQTFISQHGLKKGMVNGAGTIYYLLTPPGVAVCVGPGTSTGHCSDYSGSVGAESYKNSFCSYHSDISPTNPTTGDESTILYAVIPWTAGGLGDYHLVEADRTPADECQDGGFNPASKPPEELEEDPHQQEPNQPTGPGPDGSPDTGLADLIINQIAVEQQNTVTDPLLNAWRDSVGNELTDECRNFFAYGKVGGSVSANELTGAGTLYNQTLDGANYYLNTAFNMAALRLPYPGVPCVGGVNLEPAFTAPNAVNANETVAFDGMESDVTLNDTSSFPVSGPPSTTYATYTWNFGDGSSPVTGYAPGAPVCSAAWLSPCAGSVFHSYEYEGTYVVKLTVADAGGNVSAPVEHTITVKGQPAPQAGSTTSGSTSSTAVHPSASSAAGGSAAAPVAATAIVSRTIGSTLRSGLAVRYAVSEQVAGHFEVLLAASVARRIGLHGPAAVGLPKGTPPQIVIAKENLVTTSGGRNTVKIKLGKVTAARLHRLGRVSLIVRLVVRNGSSTAPASTTTLSTVTLSG
jgi:hypothetical protein